MFRVVSPAGALNGTETMRTFHIIDCSKLHGTSATLFGPAFVARFAAWAWTMATGRYHDFIRAEG